MKRSNFYNDRTVVVTGGSGFIGSHLCELLREAGAYVISLDDNSNGKNKTANQQILADAANLNSCRYAFNGGQVRREAPVFAVFNLAASVAGVLHNIGRQHEMFAGNVGLQTVPLAAAEKSGIPHFLQVSSVCVYAPERQAPAFVAKSLNGKPHSANAGYSYSKRVGEDMARITDLPHIVTVRPTNVFGPRDYFNDKAHVIPALIRKFIHDDVVEVYGPRDYVREFIYVEDVARGMMNALEYGKCRGVYNLGTGGDTRTTIGNLVDMIHEEVVKLTGEPKPIAYYEDKGGGDPARWTDVSRECEQLRWRHRFSLRKGLVKTIEWYLEQAVV